MAEGKSVFSKILTAAFPFATAGAQAFGGPLAAMLVNKLGSALGAVPTDGQNVTPDELEAAYVGATPEQRLKAREVELAFQKDMEAMKLDSVQKILALDVQDRGNARTMQMQTRSYIAPALAVLIVFGFLLLLLLMLLGRLHVSDQQALLLLLGGLNSSFAAVVMFYFGSSDGSRQKTEMLAKAEPIKG